MTQTVCPTIFIFRGEPDVYYKRHVLVYVTSPDDAGLHESIHVQRESEGHAWTLERSHDPTDWVMDPRYIGHVNVGAVVVGSRLSSRDSGAGGEAGKEGDGGSVQEVIRILESVPIHDGSHEAEWNCQTFLMEGLQALVDRGYQTREWYELALGELMDRLLEGAVE